MAKYKAYPEYKDSRVEWIDSIPSHWEVKPTFALCEASVQKNIDGSENNVLSLSYGNIISRDVETNFGLLPESFNTYQIVDCGDVILRLTDLQNDKNSLRVGLVKQNGIITSAYLKLKSKNDMNSGFLYRLLHSYDTIKVFYGMGGGLRQSMKFDDFRRLPLLLPPFEEQIKISVFLEYEISKIDILIEKQQQLIELLKEKRQAVISHAVTKGLNPDVPMKDSGVEWLGEVPKHWSVTRLKYECSHIVDCPHSTPDYTDEGEYPAIRTADILAGYLDLENCRRVTKPIYDERNFRLIPKTGDIIYSREGERFGIGAPIPDGAKVCLAQRVMLFRAKSTPGYLMWALNSSSTYTQAQQDCIGSTSPHVNVDTIKNFIFAWPPESEREEISNFIHQISNSAESLTVHLTKKLALLQERRTALISAAVTGKIDVRDWVAPDSQDVEEPQEATA